jgi:GAF domain-containing protein
MVREAEVIGTITLDRTEPVPFSDDQISLLQTFADQAVIAVENVRLFTELQEKNKALTQAHAQVSEALEQQTATSEILRVISSSHTDVQPVFDTIVQSGLRLLGGYSATMMLLRDDDSLDLVAYTSTRAEADTSLVHAFPLPLHGIPPGERAVHERRAHAVEDIERDPDVTDVMRETSRARGWRSNLFVPMSHGAAALGLISITRRDPGPFAADEIALLETFAAQAVIAIENVRLFKELESRTSELMRSVEQLTALGEVGRAVSSTLDLETVLSTIVSRAIQLSATDGGSVYEYDEATEEFSLRASWDLPEAYVEQVRNTRPRKGEGAVGRVAETREPVQIVDISDPAAYESRVRQMLLQIGLRALLAVPLIAEDRLVGALIVMRKREQTLAFPHLSEVHDRPVSAGRVHRGHVGAFAALEPAMPPAFGGPT